MKLTPEEMLSWIEFCPVCGKRLSTFTELPSGILLEKFCVFNQHGYIKVEEGKIVFRLNSDSE